MPSPQAEAGIAPGAAEAARILLIDDEQRELPFIVGVNCFDGVMAHKADEIREALVVGEDTPIVMCDARKRESAKTTLIELVQHALARASATLRAAR